MTTYRYRGPVAPISIGGKDIVLVAGRTYSLPAAEKRVVALVAADRLVAVADPAPAAEPPAEAETAASILDTVRPARTGRSKKDA